MRRSTVSKRACDRDVYRTTVAATEHVKRCTPSFTLTFEAGKVHTLADKGRCLWVAHHPRKRSLKQPA